MFDYFNKPPRSIKQNQGNAGPTHVCKDTCLQRQALSYHPVRARLLKNKCTVIEYAHILPNPFGMYKTKNNFMSPIFQAQEHAPNNLQKFIWTTSKIVNLSYMEYTILVLNDYVVVSINTSNCSNFVFVWWCSWCCHRMHRWKGRDMIYSQQDY